MLNILIVEDEANLGSTLEEYLKGLGHLCVWAKTGAEAREFFANTKPNLILMDIGLPDTSGLILAKAFRALRKDFVLLFLSALNDPEIKVEALEIGAEDYITKPFALKELILRLDRILKTQNNLETLPEEINHGGLKIWFRRYEVQDAEGLIISLSQKECAILELLYKKQNTAVDREEIIEQIWGDDKFPSNRTVDNYIVKLRKWCESDPKKGIEIQSIRSIGYKLIINM
ncbi:MAG: response regulator transcription factor [Bacteriovorax sp.]|nr:response regulator transcription factor [Bacteriovorax sp.]